MNKFTYYIFFIIILILFHTIFTINQGLANTVNIPTWYNVSFDILGNISLSNISTLNCNIKSLLFDIEGVMEIILPDEVEALSPLTKLNFQIKKNEELIHKIPIKFKKSFFNKNIILKIIFKYPKDNLLKFIENLKINNLDKDKLKSLILKQDSYFEVLKKINLTITENESIKNASEVYDHYTKNNFVLKNIVLNIKDSTEIEISLKNFENSFSKLNIKNIATNKEFLDKKVILESILNYIKLLYDVAFNCYISKNLNKSLENFEKIYNVVIKFNLKDIETNEIFIDSMINYSILLYELNDKQNALNKLLYLKEICEKSANSKLRYVYYNIANYYYLEKEFKKAVIFYQNALKLQPNFDICIKMLKNISENYQINE